MRNLRIGNYRALAQFVGKATQSGTQHQGKLRLKRSHLPQKGHGLAGAGKIILG